MMSFKINNYDPCVANMKINGKICTIVWYVDDSKISHEEENVVRKIISELEKTSGKMSVTVGEQHNFVGMNFRLTSDRKVEINIKDYIAECIETFSRMYRNVRGETKRRSGDTGYREIIRDH